MKRAWKLGIVVLAVSFILAVGALPAYAVHWDGTLKSISPSGNAPKSGMTKLKASNGSAENTYSAFSASNSATKFYICVGNNETRKRVSRNSFVKYARQGGSAVWFDWKWKKNSQGKRYRYIYKITSSQYAG